MWVNYTDMNDARWWCLQFISKLMQLQTYKSSIRIDSTLKLWYPPANSWDLTKSSWSVSSEWYFRPRIFNQMCISKVSNCDIAAVKVMFFKLFRRMFWFWSRWSENVRRALGTSRLERFKGIIEFGLLESPSATAYLQLLFLGSWADSLKQKAIKCRMIMRSMPVQITPCFYW